MNPPRRTRSTQPVRCILGIDPSLSSTGYAYRHDSQPYTGRIDSGKLKAAHRIVYVRNQLSRVLDVARPTTVVYEDYAMGARGNNMFHIGELGGVLKTLFWERGIDVMLVSPTALKKIIAGRGDADRGKAGRLKPMMRKALLDKFGFDIDQNDEADALALMLTGELRYHMPTIDPLVRRSLRLEGLGDCSIVSGQLQSISKRA